MAEHSSSTSADKFPDKPRNSSVVFVGADDGSTGYEVVLIQNVGPDDQKFHTLFKIEPGGDAISIGMMVGWFDMAACGRMKWNFSRTHPSEKVSK